MRFFIGKEPRGGGCGSAGIEFTFLGQAAYISRWSYPSSGSFFVLRYGWLEWWEITAPASMFPDFDHKDPRIERHEEVAAQMIAALKPHEIARIICHSYDCGREEGAREARAEIRKALGLEAGK